MINRKYFILAGVALVPLIPLVLLLTGVISGGPKTLPPVALRYWTTNEPEALAPIITAYRKSHPYVTIEVTKIPLEDYKDRLIEAWARDRGPDLYSLPSTWVGGFRDFIAPIPKGFAYDLWELSAQPGFFRQGSRLVKNRKQGISAQRLQRDFVDVVARDAIDADAIVGLPLAIDTLALYYNKDLLTRARIIEPPTTWAQLVKLVPRLTEVDASDAVVRSAIAIGTGKNVERAADIVSLLMLQNGAQMTDAVGKHVTFHQAAEGGISRGEEAVRFYTDFADPNKESYSWNANQPNSLDAFLSGKTAFFIGYGSHKRQIDAAAAPIKYGIAPMLHLKEDGTDAALDGSGNPKPVDYARYTLETVSQKSRVPHIAWDFLQYATSQGRVEAFLEKSGGVSALRAILVKQRENLDLEVFANQALTAASWYHGTNASVAEEYLTAMLDAVAAKQETLSSAVGLAAQRIQLTLLP